MKVIQEFLQEKKQKVIKTVTTKNFKVKDYKNPPTKSIKKDPKTGKPMYRSKKLPGGDVLRFAIKKKKGPKGGRTQVTSHWKKKGKR